MKITCSKRYLVVTVMLVALSVHAGDDDTGPDQARKTAPPSPRDYATAMDRLAPLSVIPGGADVSPCDPPAGAASQYTDAIEYARTMGSYSLIIWKDGQCQLERYFAPFDRDLRP